MNDAERIDIRDKAYIGHQDVIALNFIKPSGRYVFRRHFRQGLRSHVMEVLLPEDIEIEQRGCLVDGTRWYPKAQPRHIFRIFRTRLGTLEQALGEIRRVRLAEAYLLPDHLARSTEMILDYSGPKGKDLLLCGLQEYVHGEILDPWSPLPHNGLLPAMYDKLNSMSDAALDARESWIETARCSIAQFIDNIKQMIDETRHIPDLAGIGNLMMTPAGTIKLVDINNICKLIFDGTVHLDDRGYPVCDKSIEVLSILESRLIGKPVDRKEAIYCTFLESQRMQTVRVKELEYHRKNKPDE